MFSFLTPSHSCTFYQGEKFGSKHARARPHTHTHTHTHARAHTHTRTHARTHALIIIKIQQQQQQHKQQQPPCRMNRYLIWTVIQSGFPFRAILQIDTLLDGENRYLSRGFRVALKVTCYPPILNPFTGNWNSLPDNPSMFYGDQSKT